MKTNWIAGFVLAAAGCSGSDSGSSAPAPSASAPSASASVPAAKPARPDPDASRRLEVVSTSLESKGVGRDPAVVAAAAESDSEWSMTIQPDATILILHKGVPVVRAQHITWVERPNPTVNFEWTESKFEASDVRAGRATFTGEIVKLDLKATGSIEPIAANRLRVAYRMSIAKPHFKINGTVIDWTFDLKSPTFGGAKVAEPVFLENKTGWVWQVGGGRSVAVRFDPALPRIYYEAGNKNLIRSHLIGDQAAAGELRLAYTVELPEGGRVVPAPEERYGPADSSRWFRDAMTWDAAPVDLSFLNAAERPAGRRGVVKADGDRLVFADGTPARFWGTNLVANALFSTPPEIIPKQARRLSRLGYNLVRIVQHDAPWAEPNIFVDNGRKGTRRLNPQSLDRLDLWIKSLKDEGIYVWLDMVYNRALAESDGVEAGFEEIKRNNGAVYGFSYFNPDVARLMREFQTQYLSRVNRYTGLTYAADPAVLAVLVTNENDLTHHFGNNMLPDKNNPFHSKIFMDQAAAFAKAQGLPADQVWRTWEPGPNKILLNDLEHRFNRVMIDDLRKLGFRSAVATTNVWGDNPLSSLPSLTEGDVIDVHSYGAPEALSANPRYEANFIPWIGAAQVAGKPLAITEWNVQFPAVDRFTSPLYTAAIASLQGWDAPMIYCYSQQVLKPPGSAEWERRVDSWSTFVDPALAGLAPAAALAFRRGHVSPARQSYCLWLDRDRLFNRDLSPKTSAAIRTLVEQSRFSVGFDAVKELPWLAATPKPPGAILVDDPDHDFIPAGQDFVRSDTGEISRNWKHGIQTIDSPKTQAVSGWIGGKTLRLSDATFTVKNPKAAVVLSSLDDRPLSSSKLVLATAVARSVCSEGSHFPVLSEPVVATVALKTKTPGLQLLTLDSHGKVLERLEPKSAAEGIEIKLPAGRGTHWYLLRIKADPAAKTAAADPAKP